MQRYAPELQRRLGSRLKPTNDSWRMDSDLHTGQGQVALPVSCGGFFRCDDRLLALGQAGRGRGKALPGQSVGTAEPSRAACHQHRRSQRVPARDRSAQELKERWTPAASTGPVPYLNNVLEQDHRAIKRRVNASQGFRSFWAAWRTLAGYEVVHMIRKGQACGSAPAARVGLLHRFIVGMFGKKC
jgi:IS6 family transposase